MKTKKLLLTLLLFIACLGVVNAQSRSNEIENKWFAGVGVGTLVYVGEFDGDMSFTDRMSTGMNISFGRWISPYLAVKLEYSGIKAREYVASNGTYIENKWNLSNYHADVMLNTMNLFGGYKSDRVYNIYPYIGVGTARNGEIKESVFAFTSGIQNSFAVSQSFDFNFDVKGTIVNQSLDGRVGGRKVEGFWVFSVGATYKF
ncbi:MAG: hypothetical protein R3Y04_07085 [Rikenellaceae bacterium]